MYSSLRDFINCLDREGELLRITAKVSSEYEIAEICDRVSKSPDGGKALLFENTDTQFPLIINMLGSERRMQLLTNVEHMAELTQTIDSLLHSAVSPKDTVWDKLRMLPLLSDVSAWLPRKLRSAGACQQVQLLGEDAKLSLLPILKCWGFDGGRFITLPMVNTIDPDSGQRNVGMYRMQVFDDHSTGMHWHIHKSGARHYEAYRRRGERMPISVALGGDPSYTYSATAPMPDNMDEYLLAGFLRKRSVKLVKSITNDIYVPEDCDFVIEGYVDPAEEKVIEGPFGDHTGFYSLTDYYPKFHITAITHRRDAIYPATIVGVPPQEDAYIAMATERIFLSPIRFAMQPEIRDMYMPSAGTAHNLTLASIETRYPAQAHKVILSMWGAGQMMFNKYMLVTDHSVDIRSPKQVAHIMRNIDLRECVVRGAGVLDVLDHATSRSGFGGKLALDATSVSATPKVLSPSWSEVKGFEIDSRLLEEWGVILLFGDPRSEVDLRAALSSLECVDINFVVIFDSAVSTMREYDMLWLAMANSEVDRDVVISGGVMLLDARSKLPGRGENPSRFPNVVTSRPEVVEAVDARWAEYGIGEFIDSPSRKYRALELSESEQW